MKLAISLDRYPVRKNKSRRWMWLLLLPAVLVMGCESTEEEEYFWDPPQICSGSVMSEIIWYRCPLPAEESLFLVVSDMPTYGDSDSSAWNYFDGQLDICGLSEIDSGRIAAQVLVRKDGTPCTRLIKSEHVFRDSKNNLRALIDNMPDWEAGSQSGEPVNVLSGVVIDIEDGMVVDIKAGE